MLRNIFSVAFLAEKIRGNEARFLFGLALITRIIAYPFADVVAADGVARLFLAEHAHYFGGELYSYQWPSLHIHFLSLSQMIFGDRVIGPGIFDILLGAGAVVPFYLFTKNIFSKQGAFYAALIFSFCPLVFRNSFLPLSEIYNIFFCAMALWCISEGLIRTEKKIRWALFAGLFITVACGGRLEPWVLALLLGIILLFHRQWKMFIVFGMAASLFPVYWLILCYIKTGDPLISMHLVEYQNFEVIKINAQQSSKTELVRRFLFFPFSWFVVLTPVTAFIIVKMMFSIGRHFKRNKTQSLFLMSFIFWVLVFTYETLAGLRATQHRFTLILLLLSIPFYALWFERPGKMRLKKIISVCIVVLVIPWSFYWQYIPWQKLGFGRKAPRMALAEIVATTYSEVQAIPVLEPAIFITIADSMNAGLQKDDGIFIDFCDWNQTAYLGMQGRVPIGNIFQGYDYAPHHGDNGRIAAFFKEYPKGKIILSDFSTLVPESHFHGPLLEFDSVPGGLLLSPVINNGHYRLFRYVYINSKNTEIQRQNFNLAEPLFHIEKDQEFYSALIIQNTTLHTASWIRSRDNHQSPEVQIQEDAKAMVKEDKRKK